MKKIIAITITLIFSLGFKQQKSDWTKEQLEKADLAVNSNLTQEEKNIIKYLNLCRMYPQEFLKLEVLDSINRKQNKHDLKNTEYRRSLIVHLQRMKPMKPLVYDSLLSEDAKCFANEIGKEGRRGHHRNICPPKKSAECISYARNSGIEVLLQLLIDNNVKSLGHRNICLDSTYSYIGCAITPHLKYKTCSVLELKRKR